MAAAAAAVTAAGCGRAGAARSYSRFRGCPGGALLGDYVGAVYEARDTVGLTSVLRRSPGFEPDGSPGEHADRWAGPGAGGARGLDEGRGREDRGGGGGLHDAGIPRLSVSRIRPVFTYLAPSVRRLGARRTWCAYWS